MKTSKYFVLLLCITIASCSNEAEEIVPTSVVPQGYFIKKDVLSFTKGKAKKEGNSLVFVFKNKKNESITITSNPNSTIGIYTNEKGVQENIYTSALRIDNQKKEGYTSGTLELIFSEGESPLKINFYNLPTTDASGDFYEADFLSLPVTWIEDTSERFIKERFYYDANARLSRITSEHKLKNIDVKINSVDEYRWNDQGKIAFIDYNQITEIRKEGELPKIMEDNSKEQLFYDEKGVLVRSELKSIPAENDQEYILEILTEYGFDPTTGWIKSKNETWFTDRKPDTRIEFEFTNDQFGNIVGVKEKKFTILNSVETMDSYTNEVLLHDTNKTNYKANLFAEMGDFSKHSYPRGPNLRLKRSSQTFDAKSDAMLQTMEITSFNFEYDPLTGFPTQSEELRIGKDRYGKTTMDISMTMSYEYQLALVFRSK